MLSESKTGLQRCLDKANIFSKQKLLTISIKKSKTMVFNKAGRFIRDTFTLDDKKLEPVQSFCYLGVDIKCSGTVKHALNVLNDKGTKALRPLLQTIARFNISAPLSIKLFNTYISPILLYNVENLLPLTDKELTNFNENFCYANTSNVKIDITHRKLLKFALGVSRSCPNIALYGDTGEIPLSLKGYRITMNFWHRVSNLPDTELSKKALLENINIRTNWIKTIEKLINVFNLADKVGNHNKFRNATKTTSENGYKNWWKTSIDNPEISRLCFYRKIKTKYEKEPYLNISNLQHRRLIGKLRCSDHPLEIERGRHKKGGVGTPPNERVCTLCKNGQIEDEEHFLLKCQTYNLLKLEHNIQNITEINSFFSEENLENFGKYLKEAFELRDKNKKEATEPEEGEQGLGELGEGEPEEGSGGH